MIFFNSGKGFQYFFNIYYLYLNFLLFFGILHIEKNKQNYTCGYIHICKVKNTGSNIANAKIEKIGYMPVVKNPVDQIAKTSWCYKDHWKKYKEIHSIPVFDEVSGQEY